MTRVSWAELIQSEYGGRLPTIQQVTEYIKRIKKWKLQLFCILAFFTAGRISEITYKFERKFKKLAVRNEQGQTIKDEHGKTIYRLFLNPKYDPKHNIYHGIRVKDISIERRGGNDFLKISMRNNKNRKNHFKQTVTPIFLETELTKMLFMFLKYYKEDQQIITQTRGCIYKQLKKYAPLFFYPHFIRNIRLGILYNVYNFNEQEVINFAGWSDGRPGSSYNTFRNPLQFMDKMNKKIEEVKNS